MKSSRIPVQATRPSVYAKNFSCCGIDATVGGVAGVKGGDGGRLGIDTGGDANSGGAGNVDRGAKTRANASKKGGPGCGAFFGFDEFDGFGIDVGLDLAPEGKA